MSLNSYLAEIIQAREKILGIYERRLKAIRTMNEGVFSQTEIEDAELKCLLAEIDLTEARIRQKKESRP